ncbi:claudin-23 [Rhinatrema bivittatum]|uniref:claudin-23 n=1 Tax=Rhinatrema bivittatum TaxID=194408 RepID=UPI00112B9250|nr:claudin-23 [Rhinatrema bivittatum]
MRTPAVMIVGMVLGPCGLVLNLTSTLAPDWREVRSIAGTSTDTVQHQGIWDICRELEATHSRQCGIDNGDNYFQNQVVQLARGLMVASLVVTALGIALASWGVRCWQDEPHYLLSGCGGLVLFVSGVLSLIPVSWYTHLISTIPAPGTDIQVGYCLVLGYLGSCFEIIGGFSLALSFAESCNKYTRRKKYPSPAKGLGEKTNGQTAKDLEFSTRFATSSGLEYSGKNERPAHLQPRSLALGDRRDTFDHSAGHLNTHYSSHNPNWDAGRRNIKPSSKLAHPGHTFYYTNSMDVTADERSARPHSQLSSLPCDSDLL